VFAVGVIMGSVGGVGLVWGRVTRATGPGVGVGVRVWSVGWGLSWGLCLSLFVVRENLPRSRVAATAREGKRSAARTAAARASFKSARRGLSVKQVSEANTMKGRRGGDSRSRAPSPTNAPGPAGAGTARRVRKQTP